jgi:tetratricopeptide (TPR) repeat protein
MTLLLRPPTLLPLRYVIVNGAKAAVLLVLLAQSAGAQDAAAGTIVDRARAARAEGDLTAAAGLLQDRLAQAPNDTDAIVLLGFVRLAEGSLDTAEELFVRAVALAPDYADAYLGLGYVSFRKGNTREAIAHSEQALAIAPEYADAEALLENARAAEAAARAVQPRPPAPSPPAIPRPSPAVPNLPAKPSRTDRLTFATEIARGERSEGEIVVGWAGTRSTHVFGAELRKTFRDFGEATQIRLNATRQAAGVTFGGEIGFGWGADNLSRLRLGASVSTPVRSVDGLDLGLEARWERFADGDLITLAPVMTYQLDAAHVLSVRLPMAWSNEGSGTAASLDVRLRAILDAKTDLSLGFAAGNEFERAGRREVQSFSAGLSREVDQDTRFYATVSSGPYRGTRQVRLNLAIDRSF